MMVDNENFEIMLDQIKFETPKIHTIRLQHIGIRILDFVLSNQYLCQMLLNIQFLPQTWL